MAARTETQMAIERSWSGVGYVIMVHHPTQWATALLDALHEGWGLEVEHRDDLARVITHHSSGLKAKDIEAAIAKPDSLDLDAIRKGPEPRQPKQTRRDPSYCSRCGGPTQVRGRLCDSCTGDE